MPISVFLADDHPIVRSSIRNEVEKMSDFSIVGEASSADELIAFIESGSCDLLITDFNMPGAHTEDGLSMLDAIAALKPQLSILVLTMLTNSGLLRAIHDRGVAGLVSKSDHMSEMACALQTIAAGQDYVSANVRRVLCSPKGHAMKTPLSVLTEREAEVLRLFVSGRTISEIAAQRGRSVKTVSHQKISAMGKLGLRNDPELYAYAHQHGFFN